MCEGICACWEGGKGLGAGLVEAECAVGCAFSCFASCPLLRTFGRRLLRVGWEGELVEAGDEGEGAARAAAIVLVVEVGYDSRTRICIAGCDVRFDVFGP